MKSVAVPVTDGMTAIPAAAVAVIRAALDDCRVLVSEVQAEQVAQYLMRDGFTITADPAARVQGRPAHCLRGVAA